MHKLTLIFLFISFLGQAQWTKKIVDNGSEPEYRICHTKTVDGAMLKLENVDGLIAFYIQGNYTCDEEVNVELSFLVDEQNKSYSFQSIVNKDHTVVFFTFDLLNSVAEEDFRICSKLNVTVNDVTCDPKTYTFDMEGSQQAFDYIQIIE